MINSIMSAKNAQAVNFTQIPSRLSSSTPADDKTVTDTVNISNEAKYSLFASRFPSVEGNAISVRDIEESFSNTTSYIEKQLQSFYSKHGISSNSKMEISVGHDGRILVNGESSNNAPVFSNIFDSRSATDHQF